ncbi:MAG TPA: mechanosensitive ion channel family protein [Pseudomonadales bacterium]|nr:mechanosensitive ion channel family protein [Pseudomonadales bacterium]
MEDFPAFAQAAESLPPWALALLLASAAAGLMWVVVRIILAQLKRLIAHTPFSVDSILLDALRLPANLVILCAAGLMYRSLVANLGGDPSPLHDLLPTAIRILFILALIVFVDRFSTGLLGRYAEQSEGLRNSRSIVQGISRGIVVGVGGLVLLGTLGISVTPLIASLGITSLAVALALQPTLENFFSGVQLVIDKPIRVGDFIELDSGEQGFVDRIGWRSTWIRMLPNNTVIMPNSVLSQSKIINYFYPTKELSVPVELGVHYSSDLEHVERVTLEVARETLRTHKWGVPEYDTFVVYTGFGDSSINFTVMLRAQEYFNRFWVRSAFIKALHRRYAEEGINIPFPIRAINLEQEQAGAVKID